MDNKKQNNKNVAEGVKNTAGAAFHAVHRGLEVTEDAAMSAVDATANAVDNLTDNKNNRKDR